MIMNMGWWNRKFIHDLEQHAKAFLPFKPQHASDIGILQVGKHDLSYH